VRAVGNWYYDGRMEGMKKADFFSAVGVRVSYGRDEKSSRLKSENTQYE
jgi:hypothetical protein